MHTPKRTKWVSRSPCSNGSTPVIQIVTTVADATIVALLMDEYYGLYTGL
jgi:hypothetical protein